MAVKSIYSAKGPVKNALKKKSVKPPSTDHSDQALKEKTIRSVPDRPAATQFVQPSVLYRANPLERIEMARKGLPTHFLACTAKLLHTTSGRLSQWLKIPRSTVARKAPLSSAQSERLMGIMMLIGQVEAIIADAGDEIIDFDAGAWVSQWIEEPLPALGNCTAGEFMDTTEGQRLIARLLAQSVSGAYV